MIHEWSVVIGSESEASKTTRSEASDSVPLLEAGCESIKTPEFMGL